MTHVSPWYGSPSGGTSVTITGTNFTLPLTVNFGNVPATSITLVSATQITAAAPAEPSGVVDVTVTTTKGQSAFSTSDTFTYTNPPVAITTTTLPNWTAGLGFWQWITISGGTGSLTFSASGTLPTGLTLSNDGVLAGTPTAAGSYTFTITVTDAVGGSASQSYTVVINPAVTITTSNVANWTVNAPGYRQTITASGGTGSRTFAKTAGTLPAGLTLSSAGVLSGTPTATGSYTFTVTATDAVGSSASHGYTVTINPPVTITTPSLPTWTAWFAFNQTISATGGTGAKTFAKTSGTLPPTLTLSSSGVLSGTPYAAGTYTFTITATDTVGATASHTYTIRINPPVSIDTFSLPTRTAFASLASFVAEEGSDPMGGLVEDGEHNLYGTTEHGGAYGNGTIFELPYNSSTGSYDDPITLVEFNGANGANPYAGLYEDSSGRIFGTTIAGGAYNFGTVFEVAPVTEAFQTLVSFDVDNGAGPYGGIIEDNNFNLYGTTSRGGAYDDGIVFELPATSLTTFGTTIVLATFDHDNGDSNCGANPMGGVVMDSGGNLYGTTANGGANGDGTVFELPCWGGTYNGDYLSCISFNGNNGASPQSGLVVDAYGNVYGTTDGGGTDTGTVFKVQSGSGTITTLATFGYGNGGDLPACRTGAEQYGGAVGHAHGRGQLRGHDHCHRRAGGECQLQLRV